MAKGPRERWEEEEEEEEREEEEDLLSVGEVVYYQHRQSGWILVKVIKVDREGAFDGGETYVVGAAPQLRGAEVETTRRRLFRTMPEWSPQGHWVRRT